MFSSTYRVHLPFHLPLSARSAVFQQPAKADSRFDRLLEVVAQHLRDGKHWKDDERLIIFTEYKTTFDYLFRR
jgi:ERCC4-related helicase